MHSKENRGGFIKKNRGGAFSLSTLAYLQQRVSHISKIGQERVW
jgi:hypothetical protein